MISASETEGSENYHNCMTLEEFFSPFPGQFITRDSDRDGSSTGQQVSMMVITQGLVVSRICFLPHRSTRRFCKYLHFFHCPLLLSTATGGGIHLFITSLSQSQGKGFSWSCGKMYDEILLSQLFSLPPFFGQRKGTWEGDMVILPHKHG